MIKNPLKVPMKNKNRLIFCALYFTYTAGNVSDFNYIQNMQSISKYRCRSSVRHIIGHGVGFNRGYSTVETFYSPLKKKPENIIPFFDMRGHVFNNGKIAFNVGSGIRKQIKKRVYGINTYYDFRKTKKMDYNQFGLGAETLGESWDFRINGYIPFAEKITGPDEYNVYQFAMRGGDISCGYHFSKTDFIDMSLLGGFYYYKEHIGPNFAGISSGFRCRFKEYFTFAIGASYDPVFKSRLQYLIGFTIPFGQEPEKANLLYKKESDHNTKLTSRSVQPVFRAEILGIRDIQT